MIDDNRKNLSLEDYKTLKEALREQTQNWDIDVQWDEWLKTEWKDIENWVDSKAVKDFQSRILKIENEEKNVGKVAWKKVSKSVADSQQRAVETKREKLIEEIWEYYWIDQFEAADKYDQLRDSANVNKVKFQTADNLEAEYEAAVKNWDEARAKEILKEYAESKWYNSSNDYQWSKAFNWSAPSDEWWWSKEERINKWNNDEFEWNQTLWDYASDWVDMWDLDFQLNDRGNYQRADSFKKESIDNLNKAINEYKNGNKDATITMYRAVDDNIKENSFRNWDWITPSKKYAEYHITLQDWDKWRIIEEKVPLDEIWWDWNDINEWWFDNGKEYWYKNTPNNRKDLEITYDDNWNLIPLRERFNENNPDTRYQKYWTAWEWEKWVNAIQWLNIRNFKNWKSVKELADNYWIKTNIVQSISTPEWQKAYGMYWDRVITLARDLKESTVPHELLHATFDMVDQTKKNQILDGIKEKLKVDDVQAEEWLADNFSEYYRTGKFDTKAIPTTFVWQIKQFFQQIKEYIDWTYANRKEIQNLFDDIIDGKLEWEYWVYSDPKFQKIYHWSSANFEKFDSSHMGEGEWNQAHWWWHYVAVQPETAKKYASLKERQSWWVYYNIDGKPYKEVYNSLSPFEKEAYDSFIALRNNDYDFSEAWDRVKKDKTEEIDNWIRDMKSAIEYWEKYMKDNDLTSSQLEKVKSLIEHDKERLRWYEEQKNQLWKIDNLRDRSDSWQFIYEWDIPDIVKKDTPTWSNYLEEDAEIAKPQYMKIINEAKKRGLLDTPNGSHLDYYIDYATAWHWDKMTWYSLYRALEDMMWSDKKASQFLESLWYDWIHYIWEQDWEAYVIFNDKSIDIKNKKRD